MADRLNIDRQYMDGVVRDYMDKVDLLKIKSRGGRIDGFMLALAIGVKEGYRTPSKATLGIINDSATKNALPFVYSVALSELRREGKDNLINDTKEVFKIASEYANTGFKVLSEQILPESLTDFDEELFEMELIQMMDDKYTEITGEDV